MVWCVRARASLPELPSGAARTLACGPNQEVVGSITYTQARRRAGCAPVCMQPRSPPLSLSKNGIFHSTFKVMLCRRHYLVQREIPSRKGRKSWSLPHTRSLSRRCRPLVVVCYTTILDALPGWTSTGAVALRPPSRQPACRLPSAISWQPSFRRRRAAK